MDTEKLWNFRVHFRVPPYFPFDTDETEIALEPLPPAQRLTISPVASQSFVGETDFELVGESLPSPESAFACAIRSKQSLRAACVAIGGAAIFRNGQAREEIPLPDSVSADGTANVRESQGICLYPEGTRVCSNIFDSIIVDPMSPDNLAQNFASIAARTGQMDARIELALDIYCSAFFEYSVRSRFLSLITAVEIVATRTHRASEYLDAINRARGAIKRLDLEQKHAEFLLQLLGEVKRLSIGEACRQLVSAALGNERSEEFGQYYYVRSKLIHEGQAPEGVNVESDSFALRSLVADLLLVLLTEAEVAAS